MREYEFNIFGLDHLVEKEIKKVKVYVKSHKFYKNGERRARK